MRGGQSRDSRCSGVHRVRGRWASCVRHRRPQRVASVAVAKGKEPLARQDRGSVASVHCWERIGALITTIARKILHIPILRYVDDFFAALRMAEAGASIWTASPPCQPFSRLGQRKGWMDDRSRAVLLLPAAARAALPPCVVIENVWPLVDMPGPDGFAVLERLWMDAGYCLVVTRVAAEERSYRVPPRRLPRARENSVVRDVGEGGWATQETSPPHAF